MSACLYLFKNRVTSVLGYEEADMTDKSFYQFIHSDDLGVFSSCHKQRKYSSIKFTLLFTHV